MKLTKLFSRRVLGLIISTLLFISFALAAAGDVDTSFSPNLRRSLPPTTNSGITLQTNGKFIIYKNYYLSDGNTTEFKAVLYRLNADGSKDISFISTVNFSSISNVVIAQNGKILVSGQVLNSTQTLLRLNIDGTLDNTFLYVSDCACSITVHGTQPDGKVFALKRIANNGPGSGGGPSYLNRYNSDGTIDNSFATLIYSSSSRARNTDFISKFSVMSEGKLLVAGRHASYGVIFRLNPDGTRDTTFETPVTSPDYNVGQGFSASYISDFILKSDGKLSLLGYFTSINGVGHQSFSQLNSNYSVDMQFPIFTQVAFKTPTTFFAVSNGKYIVGLGRTPGPAVFNEPPDVYARFNSDGSIDSTFVSPLGISVQPFVIDSSERITTADYRLNADGIIDTSFVPFVPTLDGKVSRIFRQPDGKIIVAGDFSKANSIARTRLVRLNADGTTDNTFDAGSGFDVDPIVLNVQSDGKILAGGIFTAFNGVPKTGLVRLNSNGSLDSTFIGTFDGSVEAVLPLSTGKMLIGGSFSSFSGTARPKLARLNADGTLDSTFNASVSGGGIYSILLQSDGKIMVSGSFAGIGGFARTNYARLNSDGSVDSTFNAGNSPAGSLTIVQTSGGKYLLMLTSPSNFNSVIRLNADGSSDGSFQNVVIGGLSRLSAMVVQADGLIVIGGAFTSVNGVPKNNFARLKTNGALDAAYVFEGADDQVNAMVAQPDGKLFVGGNFTTVGGVARTGLARINNIALIGVRPLFDFDGDGKADISVFRASTNTWYRLLSGNSSVLQSNFAVGGDIPTPADFDGDGKTDLAIFRPSNGDWWYLSSLSGTQVLTHWGQNGDIPRPSDFDGDGRTDFVIYRPAENNWYRYGSTGQVSTKNFGSPGDKPVIGDFDGDGKSDVAIFRPSTGDWWYQSSVDNSQRATHWGISTDVPAAADFDGDGKTDFAVYRPTTGTWYISGSSTGSATVVNFGIAEDKPVAADYDGDGKADIAVYRPSTGIWYLLRSNAGFAALQFGISSDVPVPYSFVP